MKIVFDASTLILLAKVDILREALDVAAGIIPATVRKEGGARQVVRRCGIGQASHS